MHTIAITGHRPKYFGTGRDAYDERNNDLIIDTKRSIEQTVEILITQMNTKRFIVGMALGVDTWAAEAVLGFQKKYPHVELIAAVPCEQYDEKWPESARLRYRHILKQANKRVLVSKGEYTSTCLSKRNQWMVNHADGVLAVWNGDERTGTGATIAYAKQEGKPVQVVRVKTIA